MKAVTVSPKFQIVIPRDLRKSMDIQPGAKVQILQAEEKPFGVPGSELLRFAGAIAPEDLNEMEKAMAEGCEQVNLNDW